LDWSTGGVALGLRGVGLLGHGCPVVCVRHGGGRWTGGDGGVSC
jgi:hypothetical protein